MQNTLTRSTTSLRTLCEAAQDFGVERSVCLHNTGFSEDDLIKLDAETTLAQEMRAIENFVRHANQTVGLGVAVGERLHVHSFGIWGFAILTSSTLRAAILTAIDYVKISFLIADMRLAEENDRGKLEFDLTQLPAIIRPYVLERHAVVTMSFIKELVDVPDFDEFKIETTIADTTYARDLSKILGTEVVAGAKVDALTWPARLLDQQLPKSDPISLKFCLDQCKALVNRKHGVAPTWSQKVRDAVTEKIAEDQKIERIAAKLSVTERTLRRRLADEETSFRDIYTDARLTIANELLEVTGLNVETVAWRVGYSEPASFVRAFTKKFEKTPGEVRKWRLQGAVV